MCLETLAPPALSEMSWLHVSRDGGRHGTASPVPLPVPCPSPAPMSSEQFLLRVIRCPFPTLSESWPLNISERLQHGFCTRICTSLGQLASRMGFSLVLGPLCAAMDTLLSGKCCCPGKEKEHKEGKVCLFMIKIVLAHRSQVPRSPLKNVGSWVGM